MVKRLLTRIIIEQANEILVFNLITNPPPLPPSDAIRLLYVCPFCVDGGVWSDGISLLCTAQDGIDHHLCLSCCADPTLHQNRPWTHDVEHR